MLKYRGVQKGWAALAAIAAVSISASASVYDQLPDGMKNKVQKGEVVLVTRDVGKTWPEAIIYVRIDATPEEAMAVFTDYEFQATYIENLEYAKIVKRHNARTTDIAYRLLIPMPFPMKDKRENYVVRDVISQPGAETYRVDWTLVSADTTKETVGYAYFERLGTGTFLVYKNFVEPGSSLAGIGFVRDKAMLQVKNTAASVRNKIQQVRVQQPKLLERQLKVLREALR